MNIDDIVNRYYRTDKGYLYLVDLIKNKFPTLKINNEVLNSLTIRVMSKEEFLKKGYVGLYKATDNSISIFTNKDDNGEKILDYDIDDEYIINTFLHELIHALTSVLNEDKSVIEGINIRLPDGNNSFFVALNEGITQMITDDVMGKESDAYVFETIFARQLALILGKEKLIEIYSSNNPNNLIEAINELKSVEAIELLQKMYYFQLVNQGVMADGGYNLGTSIQIDLINLYKASNLECNGEFYNLLLDSNKVSELLKLIPASNLDINSLGFNNIDVIKEGFKNGKRF